MGGAESLARFFETDRRVVRIALTRVEGSSPREAGTEMFVSKAGLWGTIGGGQLEFRAIDAAREMLEDGCLARTIDLPLGPEIGQCCGGRVEMSLARMGEADRRAAETREGLSQAGRPHVYVMGAGHVGRALADLFQHCPVRCVLVDPRPEELARSPAAVEKRVSAIPEVDVANAPRGSAFIVLTHDHSLDFLIASAAIERRDAAYVGMIGSRTKRAKLRAFMREHSDPGLFEDLTCPIGAGGSADKRPAVIAAFVLAEVMARLTCGAASPALRHASEEDAMPDTSDRAGAHA
ncbi:xanthine dehydrogenase accessory protein XdhC [Fulvimarina endophytica]|uniref:Xanthine dehydrogenase accessory protein XdhC n=1 Tax=Fulvimarina endophytica TaxID=2293836 RepID=A0A371X5F4_9HYPH|nr:xanthine dehydrogenase accessory protein XdhC [Fulvimarina endophytica]RFC64469.1 xanthine dehydrogenase accessory protein XdhC [Fulvimarina endophytica]